MHIKALERAARTNQVPESTTEGIFLSVINKLLLLLFTTNTYYGVLFNEGIMHEEEPSAILLFLAFWENFRIMYYLKLTYENKYLCIYNI